MTALARPRLAKALLPLGLLLAGGCNLNNSHDTGIDTGIIVEVSTDLRVPDEIDQVHLRAAGPQGNIIYDYTYDLGEGANQVMFPFRTGLYPLHDTSTPIHLEALGQVGAQLVVRRSATLSFLPGKKVVLALPLLRVCTNVACNDASTTCAANGACYPDIVDSSTLPPYVPNQSGGGGGFCPDCEATAGVDLQ